jgi:hypothetical protein
MCKLFDSISKTDQKPKKYRLNEGTARYLVLILEIHRTADVYYVDIWSGCRDLSVQSQEIGV